MTQQLPPYDKVFFVHYQCQNFNEGDQIFNLCIIHNNKVTEFSGNDEALFIQQYCTTVAQKCNQGLIPIHWNQNRGYFGIGHITSRYLKLTGKIIPLHYLNDIDLASLLIERLGDDYVAHPRLDNLAKYNQCYGSSAEKKNERTYPSDRAMLISKIYHKLLNNKLKTSEETTEKQSPSTPIVTREKTLHTSGKSFIDFLIHSDKVKLANALRDEFHHEKGKTIRFLLEAMKQDTPIISICNGENKSLHNAMTAFFPQNIGSYNSIFQFAFQNSLHKEDVNAMRLRINFILDKLAKQP